VSIAGPYFIGSVPGETKMIRKIVIKITVQNNNQKKMIADKKLSHEENYFTDLPK
jgi:hypothetical protein